MKRMIVEGVTGKKASGKAFADAFNNSGLTMYTAKYDEEHNLVYIQDKTGKTVSQIELDYKDVQVPARKFRKATDAELNDDSIQKYVVDKYTRNTTRQTLDEKVVRSIAHEYK